MSRELSLAEIFQLGYYWETKTLLTAVRLDVFSSLDGKRKTLSEVADRIGAHAQTLGLLLNALVAMRLLETGSVAAILAQSSGDKGNVPGVFLWADHPGVSPQGGIGMILYAVVSSRIEILAKFVF